MKHLFIVNPVAGKGKALKLLPEIRSCFEAQSEEFIIHVTEYPGHATEIARKYCMTENYRIYSVGGDGTLNEVLNGMAGSGSSLAVIPSGTGNDFVRNIIGNSGLKNIIQRTIGGTERLIDLAKVNGKYYINIASIGFDAHVAHKAETLKKIPLISGKMAYIFGIFTAIMECANPMLEIKIDEKTFNSPSLLIAVANGKWYGGGMMAAPNASISDGLFDICHAEKMGRLDILRLFPRYMKGTHESIEGVHFYRAKKVEIAAGSLLAINIDGEITEASKAVFELIPHGIEFVFPSEQDVNL